MRIAFIGSARSIHFQRWVDWFRVHGHMTVVLSDAAAREWDHDVTVIPSFGRVLRGRLWKYGEEVENFRKARWLKGVLTRERVEILQAHTLGYPGFVGLLSAFRPFAVHFYNGDILWKANTSIQHKLRTYVALKRADLVTGFSRAQVERCLRLGARPERTHQAMLGVDVEKFRPKEDLGPTRERLGINTENVVFSPRGLSRLYNIESVIKAAALVVRKVPDTLFILASLATEEDPSYAEYVRALITDLGLGANVKVVRSIPYSEIPDYYACSKVTVSVATSDNLPLSIMEAMASGSACVVGDTGSFAELVEHGKEGLCVDAEAPAEIAESIVRLLEDDGLRGSLTVRARERAVERCDHDKWMRQMEAHYSKLVARAD